MCNGVCINLTVYTNVCQRIYWVRDTECCKQVSVICISYFLIFYLYTAVIRNCKIFLQAQHTQKIILCICIFISEFGKLDNQWRSCSGVGSTEWKWLFKHSRNAKFPVFFNVWYVHDHGETKSTGKLRWCLTYIHAISFHVTNLRGVPNNHAFVK